MNLIRICVVLSALIASSLHAMNVELQIKECAKVGAPDGFPISAVVPLPERQFQDITHFRITNETGVTVPAQFSVLNRNWVKDNSIANLLVTFQPVVSSFSGAGTGIAKYYLKDDGSGNATGTNLQTTETTGLITVVTGPIKFTVSKTAFNIINELWLDKNGNGIFESSEQIIVANVQNGGVFLGRLPGDMQFDASRNDVAVTVEEAGPMRVIIKAEALTKYYSTVNHMHGYAVRLYAYANKPYIKIDYQLQNSAKNKVVAWPLYFKSMNLDFRLSLGSNPAIRAGLPGGTAYQRSRDKGLLLAQEKGNKFQVRDLAAGVQTKRSTDGSSMDWLNGDNTLASGAVSPGYLDVSDGSAGVTAMTRYFSEMWPNGLCIDSTNKLQVQLFPEWSAGWYDDPLFSRVGCYWLEDMHHVFKEVLLVFHNGGLTTEELNRLSKTFQYPPVAAVPTAWYAQTHSSLDLGGVIPYSRKISDIDTSRTPGLPDDGNSGWDYFSIIDQRRTAVAAPGGWPSGGGGFYVTENPADYYRAEQNALGELNSRPHSMAHYTYKDDYNFLFLGSNVPHNRYLSYQSDLWRRQLSGSAQLDTAYLDGSAQNARPRDDAHRWYYHISDAYFMSGNLWIKDWYQFFGEFLKNQVACSTGECGVSLSRGTGHDGANALSAYRITGDTTGYNMLSYFFFKRMGGAVDRLTGTMGTADYPGWQEGFGMRGMANYLEAIKDETRQWQRFVEVYSVLSGLVEGNYQFGHFGYHGSLNNPAPSSCEALTYADPVAWYARNSGIKKYRDQLIEAVEHGLFGGTPICGEYWRWKGSWEGRYVQFMRSFAKTDSIAPDAISDLSLSKSGASITLKWTAPSDAQRYMIVWGDRFLSETLSRDISKLNWWAANPVGPLFLAVPGSVQSASFTVPETGQVCAAIFSFDSAYNLSAMSNQVFSDTTVPTVPSNLRAVSIASNRISLAWKPSVDPESKVRFYSVYRNHVKVATVSDTVFTDSSVREKINYTYQVSAISAIFSESRLSDSLLVSTPVDVAPPQVIWVIALADSNKVQLGFDEAVDPVVMGAPSDYSFSNGLGVVSVHADLNPRIVTLFVSRSPVDSIFDLTIDKLQDVAATPNVLRNIHVSVKFIGKLVISETKCSALGGNGKPLVPLWDVLSVGKLLYVDGRTVLDSMSGSYEGITYMRTFDGQSTKTGSNYISFKISQPCTVLIAHNDPCNKVPAWMTSANYTFIGDTIKGVWQAPDGINMYRVYAKACTAGTVSLGGQAGSSDCGTYWVMVKGNNVNYMDPTAVENSEAEQNLPDLFSLYPNPFNPSVSILLRLSNGKSATGKTWTRKLSIFDIRGVLVATIAPSEVQYNTVKQMTCRYYWNAGSVPSGTYFVRTMDGKGGALTRKVILMK